MLLLDCVMDYDKSCPQCEFSSGSECPKKRQKRDNIRKDCLKLYEICGELGLKCLRMEWDTDSNGMWNGDYKGIDDWLTKDLKSGLRAA